MNSPRWCPHCGARTTLEDRASDTGEEWRACPREPRGHPIGVPVSGVAS